MEQAKTTKEAQVESVKKTIKTPKVASAAKTTKEAQATITVDPFADALDKLRQAHESLGRLIEYRVAQKNSPTRVKNCQKEIAGIYKVLSAYIA